jgi:hypothetical protein
MGSFPAIFIYSQSREGSGFHTAWVDVGEAINGVHRCFHISSSFEIAFNRENVARIFLSDLGKTPHRSPNLLQSCTACCRPEFFLLWPYAHNDRNRSEMHRYVNFLFLPAKIIWPRVRECLPVIYPFQNENVSDAISDDLVEKFIASEAITL